MKKGQINLGFVVAVLLLIVLIISTTMTVVGWAPEVVDEARHKALESKATDLGKLILEDPGMPADWNDPTLVDVPGLALYNEYSKETVIGKLDTIKIVGWELLGYQEVKIKLGLDNDTNFRLTINSCNTTDFYGSLPDETTRVVRVRRHLVIGNLTNNDCTSNVTLWVW
ncbi:MAG: hypothetical protein ABIG20_04805 [archaeon]